MDLMIKNDNSENLDLLKKTMSVNQNVLVFAGAGSSKFLGMKTWTALLEEMRKEFHSDLPLIETIKINGYAKTASMIYHENPDIEIYKKFLQKQFTPKYGNYYSLHNEIINLFNLILTTNYDVSFEKAFDSLNRSFKANGIDKEIKYKTEVLPDIKRERIQLQNPTIVYLHGNIVHGTSIFREEEYEVFYPSILEEKAPSELEIFLKSIIQDFTILFIGFSFDDKIFVEFFQKTLKEITDRPKEFERLWNHEYSIKLPNNFVIFRNQHLELGVNKEELIKLFNKDISWKELFIDPDIDELIFRKDRNIQKLIEDLNISDDSKLKIKKFYETCKGNEDKKRVLDSLHLKVIGVDEHNENESILIDILQTLGKSKAVSEPAKVEYIGDATHANRIL